MCGAALVAQMLACILWAHYFLSIVAVAYPWVWQGRELEQLDVNWAIEEL